MTVRVNLDPTPPPTPPGRGLAEIRVREALGHDAVLIAEGAVQGAPMQMPPGAWALLITAADRSCDTGEIVLFAARWCEHEVPAVDADGDLIVQLHPLVNTETSTMVKVEMAIASRGRWVPAGTWPHLDDSWPAVIAPTAAAIVSATMDATLLTPVPTPLPVADEGVTRRVSLRDLLDARLLAAWDRLTYRRPTLGIHRAAHLTYEGHLRMDDGRLFSSLSAATTALGSPHQNGWHFWHRHDDGRLLATLRDTFINQYSRAH